MAECVNCGEKIQEFYLYCENCSTQEEMEANNFIENFMVEGQESINILNVF